MKKMMKSVLCSVLLLSLLMSMLVGCKVTWAEKLNRMDETERVGALSNLISEKLEESDSYTIELELDIKCVYQEVDMEINAENEMRYTGLLGESPAYHNSGTVRMEAMEGLINTTARQEEGYRNGKMYRSYREGDTKQKLWSPISWEDYSAYQDSKSKSDIEFDFQPEDCTDITCLQEEDGSWSASLKITTEDGMKGFLEMIADFEEMLGNDCEVEAVVFAFQTNESFYLTNFTIEFEFAAKDKDSKADLPELKIEADVSDYGTTELEEIKFDDYTEVVDLRVLNIPAETIKDFTAGEEGVLEFSLDQCIRYAGQKQENSETDRISFTDKDGKYTFRVEAKQEDYDIFLTYADGKRKTVVMQGSEEIDTDTEDCTDEEARAFIDGLVMQSGFDPNLITDIELKKGEENVYIFHMQPEKNALLAQMMESAGSDELGATRKVNYTATIVDGKLLKLEFLIDANIKTEEGMLYVDLKIVYDYTAK